MRSVFIKICIVVILGVGFSIKSQNLQISGGNSYSVSLCSNGSVYAWGGNTAGELGRDASNVKYSVTSSSTPLYLYKPASDGKTIRSVDAGSGNTGIALACDGTVWQWGGICGNGNFGIGTAGGSCSGTPTDGSSYYSTMQQVKGVGCTGFLTGVSYINASTVTSYAVLNNGEVLSWGNNAGAGSGALGNGTGTNTGNTYCPDYVLTAAGTRLTNIKIVEGADYSGYALSNDGYVYSWGYNSNNDLGRTVTAADQYYARRVQAWDYTKNDGSLVDLSNIIKITGGDTHGLAIDANGNLWSWGGNWGAGQRGFGQTAGTALPYATKVVAPQASCFQDQWKVGPWITNAKEISAGQQHSIVLLDDGRVVTFGNNTNGQLGDGTTTATGCPVYVKTNATTQLTGIVAISDGDLWSFALNSAGQVYVWGKNGNGELAIAGGSDVKYATLNTSIPTTCGVGSLLACPTAYLGADILKCEGVSTTLLAGAEGDTYTYSWYSSTTGVAGSWVLIGAADRPYNNGTGSQLTVTAPLYYKVIIKDTRGYVADKCGPCPQSRDSIRVQDRVPPLGTSAAGTCGATTACFDIAATGAVDNTQFDWFANQTTTTKLNTTRTDQFCTPTSGLTLNGTNYEIWVEDKRTFQSTVGPTTAPCTPSGGTDGTAYQQMFIVYQDIVITSVDVMYKTYTTSATPDAASIKVYSNDPNKNSSTKDGVNTLVSTTASVNIPRTSTTHTLYTLSGLNLTLTGSPAGTKYWLEVSGVSSGNFAEFTCAATYPYLDAVTGQTVVTLQGSTASKQEIQQTAYKGSTFNWKFNYADGYLCGRFKLTAPQSTAACLATNFLYFSAKNIGNSNLLTWASERTFLNSSYEILKSNDGKNFNSIGIVKPAENTFAASEFSFNDYDLTKGISYYKIVQKSNQSADISSNIISINNSELIDIEIVPNPNSGKFTIVNNGVLANNTKVNVFSLIGNAVFSTQLDSNSEFNSKEFDLSHLTKGVYFIILNDGENKITKKIILD